MPQNGLEAYWTYSMPVHPSIHLSTYNNYNNNNENNSDSFIKCTFKVIFLCTLRALVSLVKHGSFQIYPVADPKLWEGGPTGVGLYSRTHNIWAPSVFGPPVLLQGLIGVSTGPRPKVVRF